MRMHIALLALLLPACGRPNPDADFNTNTPVINADDNLAPDRHRRAHPLDLGAPPDIAQADLAQEGKDGGVGGALLNFAVFGDCRPPNIEGTNNYPSTIISGIFALAQQHGAQLAIGTGDYMFTNTQSGVAAQIGLFKQARASYGGPVYLTMGNHECNGFTASNCPNFNETPNVQGFMGLLPAGVSTPYYRLDVPTPLGKAKFLFVAANAWSAVQQAWLQQQLADPTTYTFVMRHEPAKDTTAPGVGPSESLIQKSKYTLELLGHTHEYKRVDTQHVISGNAGAPLQSSSGSSFGLLMIQQQANGNVAVSEIDEATGSATDSWTVTPDGQPAP